MEKKFLSILLTLVLVLGLLPAAGAAAVSTSPTFSDMPDNWATEALESAVANGLLVGDDGKIMPDSPLTRAQMATIIARAFGATEEGDISVYSDVKSTDWFAVSMAKAYKMGVMQGYAGKMDPNSNITREQAFAVLARALKLEISSSINKTFEDEGEISDWAKGEVYALVNAGYIQGSNGRLNPQANISRAEFAQMMHNLIKQYIKAEGEYTQVADGNIMVNVPNVTLKNVTITGDLIVGDGVGDGALILDNVTIKGRLVVRGGGVNSIIIIGGSVEDGSTTNNSQGTDVITPPPSGGYPSYVAVSAISVEPKELTLLVEETAQLTATVTPSNATNKKINWSSSDEEVATVDASGNVTAVAVGTATITATSDADSSKKDSCIVKVIVPQDIQIEGNGFVNSTSYRGVFVEISLPGSDNDKIQSFRVELYNEDDELIGTNTLKEAEKAHGTGLTSPFVVIPGSYTSQSWTTTWEDGEPRYDNPPAYALITAVDKNGVSYTAQQAYSGDWRSVWAYDIQVAGNGFVNSNSYKGVFVEISLRGEDKEQITSFKVELFNDANELIGTNKLIDSTKAHGTGLTSPFVVIPGSYTSQSWTTTWVDGELSASNAPVKAVITAEDNNGVSYTAEAAYTGDWASIWVQDITVASANDSGINDSESYKGVVATFTLGGADIGNVKSVKAELFDAEDNLLATNTLRSSKFPVSAGGLTAPIVAIEGTYAYGSWEKTVWAEGNPDPLTPPSYVKMTLTDENGLTYSAEESNLHTLYSGGKTWSQLWEQDITIISANDSGIKDSEAYKGVAATFTLGGADIGNVKSVKAELFDAEDNLLATNTLRSSKFPVSAGNLTSPIVAIEGTYAYGSWEKTVWTEGNPDPLTPPSYVKMTLTDNNGVTYSAEERTLHTQYSGGKTWSQLWPNSDASISGITVAGVEATADAEDAKVYHVELPFGTNLGTLTASDIAVTPTDANATVADATTDDGGATWTVVVTAEDETTTETYTINVTVKNLFAGGDGTEEDPYQIETFEHLKALEKLPVINGTYYFKLEENIEISSQGIDVPCYDLVMDLNNHTIFCYINGGNLIFGTAPYDRQANYTIKNGSFSQRYASQMLSFINVNTVNIENCYFYHEMEWEVNKNCNPVAVAALYYSAQNGKQMTYNIKDCHFNETTFSVGDRYDASAEIDVNMTNVVFAGAKTDETYEYGRYSEPAFKYGQDGLNYGRTYGDIALNNVKFFVKPTNNNNFDYDKCGMTIYTGSNASGKTNLTINGVEYDAVTGTMGRNDHTPSMFVYARNNYSYVDVIETGSNSYKIDGIPVDYKGIVLAPVVNVTRNKGYETIQAAINDAGIGETIEVAAGTYNESIIIDEANLTLKSKDGADKTIIDADGARNAVKITADGVTVDGFTITGANYQYEGAVFLDRVEDCIIKNNLITSNYRAGIFMQQADNNTIEKNTIRENTIGIHMVHGSFATDTSCNYNTIIDNTIEDNAAIGISLSSSYLQENAATGNEIKNNIIKNNNTDTPSYQKKGKGITITGVWVSNTIEDNTISGHNYNGISSGNSAQNNVIKNNSIDNNGKAYSGTGVENGAGIYFASASEAESDASRASFGNIIEANTITNNWNGIDLRGLTGKDTVVMYDNTIRGNTISSNTVNGIYLYDGVSNNTIEENMIVNNATHASREGYGVHATQRTEGNVATHNWWGSANGPGQDGANGVSENVTYDPWYTDEEMTELSYDEEGTDNVDTFDINSEALGKEASMDEEEIEEIDIIPLENAIQAAIAAKEGVEVSEDGADVPAGTYWVTQEDMDALNAAIAAAEAAKESAETQQDVAEAVEALEAAVSTFNDAKQEAIDEEEIGASEEGEEPVQGEELADDEESVEDEEAVEGEEQEE